MDEVIEFETDSGGLVLLDPFVSDLLGPGFGYRLGIVMDPEGRTDQAVGDEPWARVWLTAAEPLQELQEEGRFQVILTGDGVFHIRVTDEKHQLRLNAESSLLCGRLRIESGRLVLVETWPDPENLQEVTVPPGHYYLWLHTLPIPPDETRTVGVFGSAESPFLALQLSQEPPREAPATTFPPRLPLPEDPWDAQPGWLCQATVKRSEGDFLLLDLHRTRRVTFGQGRMLVRSGERLRPDDRILVRLLSQAQGYWNVELQRRL